jgi:Na+/serine symporter
VTAAFAGAAITFTGITIAAVSTIDTILKRFNSFTPEIFAARLNFDVAKANFSR